MFRALRYVVASDNKANRRISSMTNVEIRATEPLKHSVFAHSTSAGAGGISTLLLDGADALSQLRSCFRPRRSLAALKTSDPILGKIVDRNGRVIDEVILSGVSATDS